MYQHLTQVAAHQSFENILCQCLVTPERDAFCHTWSYIFTLNLTSHTSHHIFIIIIHYRTFHVTIQYSIIIQFVSPPPSSSLIFWKSLWHIKTPRALSRTCWPVRSHGTCWLRRAASPSSGWGYSWTTRWIFQVGKRFKIFLLGKTNKIFLRFKWNSR